VVHELRPWQPPREGSRRAPLLSYGAPLGILIRRAGVYVDRVLWGGAKPADLPNQLPAKIDLTVNLKTWQSMSPARQKSFQAAADKAIRWSAAEHLKREVELAESFKKQGLEIYTPNVGAFREYAQKIYLASDEAKEWPKGMLEKINALK